jgi:integrase
MSIVKHANSPNWYYSFQLKGKKYFGSTGTTNKTVAKKVEEAERRKAIEDSMKDTAEPITLKEAGKLFLDSKKENNEYGNFKGRVSKLLGSKNQPGTAKAVSCFGFDGNRYLHDIKTKDVQRLILERRKEKNANATILHELLALNGIIKLCRKLGYEVPVLNMAEIKRDNAIKPDRRRIRFLSLEEEEKLLYELHPDRKLRGLAASKDQTAVIRQIKQDAYEFVVLLLDLGCRHSELSTLQWKDVRLDRNEIQLYRPKVGNQSMLQLTHRAREILLRRFDSKKDSQEYIFENKSGDHRRYSPGAFRSACRRAGIKGVSFHNLRKTCASRLVQNNVPIHYVSKILGHSTVDITASYYADLAPSDASKVAVDVLNRLHDASGRDIEQDKSSAT